MLNNKAELYKIIIFRFCIATVILVVNTALFGLARTPVYLFVASIYLLTIVYSLLLLSRISTTVGFLYAQIIIDLTLETLLIHYTGGIDSVLGILYPLSSIAASILISPRAAVIIALLGSILYSAVVSLEYYAIIPLPSNIISIFPRESTYVFSLLYLRVTVFCIIGFLSAYIAAQVKKRDKVVMSLEEKLRREDRLSAIGKLAASTAHEIRNPLASISGCVEALNDMITLDDNSQKLFNLIIKETARLNNIINGLLEYVKPRKLRLESVSTDELMDEVLMLVQNSKDFKPGVVIEKAKSLKGIKVSCDGEHIKQVFFNLLINAVEAVGEKGKITIRQSMDEKKSFVEIEIGDNGVGIDKELLNNLFEPFSSGKEKGVGLGLSIVYSIIKEHKGTIDVVSVLGKGATFKVTLPINN
ncbi:MAG: GHKL domain-containing protein [PVC group bacterium]|nr:GHKL domain-containing protein [PVC group bacterium]